MLIFLKQLLIELISDSWVITIKEPMHTNLSLKIHAVLLAKLNAQNWCIVVELNQQT